MKEKLLPGSRYRHYKTGGVYRVLMTGTWEPSTEECVVYQSEADGRVWVRPAEVFQGCVEDPAHGDELRPVFVRRFAPLEPEEGRDRETLRILRDVAGAAGHAACWYNPEALLKLMEVWGVEPPPPEARRLPPRPEFRAGCRAFEDTLYGPAPAVKYYKVVGLGEGPYNYATRYLPNAYGVARAHFMRLKGEGRAAEMWQVDSDGEQYVLAAARPDQPSADGDPPERPEDPPPPASSIQAFHVIQRLDDLDAAGDETSACGLDYELAYNRFLYWKSLGRPVALCLEHAGGRRAVIGAYAPPPAAINLSPPRPGEASWGITQGSEP